MRAKPTLSLDERGCTIITWPEGFRGPYPANVFAESDADVLTRVVSEIRAHFEHEDPATNPAFADFLRDLDRLERLARSLRGGVEIRTGSGGSILSGVAR